MSILVVLGLLGWLYLAVFHGAFWRPLIAQPSPEPEAWPSVDIIVPARNEADSLPQSLPSLLAQNYPGAWRVLLVDDHSEDTTAEVARRLANSPSPWGGGKGAGSHAGISLLSGASGQVAPLTPPLAPSQGEGDIHVRADRLKIIAAPDLPKGWVGKVAAMQAGVAQSQADYILFTDADIRHPANSLRRLVARATFGKLDLVSLMVRLHCASAAEKLLIPAFVFFFAMLYPFRRANDPASNLAAAAGGVMLLRRAALNNAGGLAAIKSAVIDDCALAKIIKRAGGALSTAGSQELSLANDVHSLRVYPAIGDVWRRVARTAFTQLRCSYALLFGVVVGMGLLFAAPVVAFLFGNLFATAAGFSAWLAMTLLYMPMVRFYRLPAIWALTLPLAALIYSIATVDSARLFLQGRGGQWKGRAAAGEIVS
jgi:hopene-associated glycosyltransferase HpnB